MNAAYVEVARVEGHERIDLDLPYPVTVIPAELVS